MKTFPTDTLWVSLLVAVWLGALAGILLSRQGNRLVGVAAGLWLGIVVWMLGWGVTILIHFVLKAW